MLRAPRTQSFMLVNLQRKTNTVCGVCLQDSPTDCIRLLPHDLGS